MVWFIKGAFLVECGTELLGGQETSNWIQSCVSAHFLHGSCSPFSPINSCGCQTLCSLRRAEVQKLLIDTLKGSRNIQSRTRVNTDETWVVSLTLHSSSAGSHFPFFSPSACFSLCWSDLPSPFLLRAFLFLFSLPFLFVSLNMGLQYFQKLVCFEYNFIFHVYHFISSELRPLHIFGFVLSKTTHPYTS